MENTKIRCILPVHAYLNSRIIQLARPKAVCNATGCQIDSISPLSWQLEGFHSYLDQALVGEPTLAMGTEVWGYEILITPLDLLKASSAFVMNLAERDKTVLPQV